MRTIIVGAGEIGQALKKVLSQYEPAIIDKNPPAFSDYGDSGFSFDIVHICFGYDENFINEVDKYNKIYAPKYIVIHSTTPVGTCSKLRAIHSPVIGQHPFLEEGLRTFTKMLGGEQASEVADYFRRAGIKVAIFDKPETTEAAKLFLTEYYRECINFAKRVKTYADKHGLSFSEIYTVPNNIYNEGYKKLGCEEFIRPVLQPIMTPTGGHCVSQNEKLIRMSE